MNQPEIGGPFVNVFGLSLVQSYPIHSYNRGSVRCTVFTHIQFPFLISASSSSFCI